MKDFEIREDTELGATPPQVWDAIATRDGLASWFQPADLDPDGDLVEEWSPPERLVTQMPGATPGTSHRFDYAIEPRDGEHSRLRFTYTGTELDGWDEEFTAKGWRMYFATLARYLEHFGGRTARYIEAEGPEATAKPGAWRNLLAGLGLADPVEAGQAVRIELPGARSIEGVVDYVTADFLGITTPDALIRFHGRAPIGMSIAVSHHAFSAVDVETTAHAWERWLTSIVD